MEFMLKLFQAFNPSSDAYLFMWAILITGVFSLSIMIERYLYLSLRKGVKAELFIKNILEFVSKDDIAAGVKLCQKAYKMAGIQKPLAQLDVAEVHDISSFHELMEYEGLGFCKPGEGGQLIDQGVTSMKGKLPVNPSGGALCSHPYTAIGLIRVAEAALQVMNRAGGHQVPGAKTALAHGVSGMCCQSNCVLILGK